MTLLGKIIVSLGIGIFTGATITWIITGDWHWFAGGGAIFLASIATAAVVSAETKVTSNGNGSHLRSNDIHSQESFPLPQNGQATKDKELLPIQNDTEGWEPPLTPPPDEQDPFSRPAQK